MPNINLPDYLKYFFTPFVVAAYYCMFNPINAAMLLKDFGTIPAIASLFAGVSVYYIYRYLIYNDLIMPVYDLLRKISINLEYSL